MLYAMHKSQNTDGPKQSLKDAFVILKRKSADDDDLTTCVLKPMCVVYFILHHLF
jgi:hypothetical protein